VLIYACVSGHGFGHGSRTAAVLMALRSLQPDWRLVVSTSLPPAFLSTALQAVAGDLIEHRCCRWDVGVVQADALGADAPATLAALADLEQDLPGLIARESAWLRHQREPVLVLADVPPAAARLARELGAPLVWLGNFGWDAIYAAMGPAFDPWATAAHDLYRRGDLLLRCPLSMPMDWGVPPVEVGLTCGEPTLEPAVVQQRLQWENDGRPCVLVTFGGMGFRLEPDLFTLWPDHRFVVADPSLAIEGSPSNVALLPRGIRPLEVMSLCSRMITKPGYSSFCEALSQGVGLHVVRREGFAEAAVLEQGLVRHGHHRLLSQEQLRSGDWQLDQPLRPPSGPSLSPNGALQAAHALARLALERA
jgi:hypothetical protein